MKKMLLIIPISLFTLSCNGDTKLFGDNQGPRATPLGGDDESSFMPTILPETFEKRRERLISQKPEVEERQNSLLEMRYDLSNDPSDEITMTTGKPVQ